MTKQCESKRSKTAGVSPHVGGGGGVGPILIDLCSVMKGLCGNGTTFHDSLYDGSVRES